jgi:uncharacterized oxidoreductase
MKLTDQTILITGGGSGIGLGLAEAFKKLGNQVIVAGRSKEKLQTAQSKGLETLTVDMTDTKTIQSFAKEVLQRYPTLNCVIHNAGIMVNEKFIAKDNSQLAADTILTNLLGPITLTNALLPHFLKQKSATVMTVTSGLAYIPLAMTPTYCASKAALHSYTESLRYQLQSTSIEVKELVPPYVRTSLMGDRQASDSNAMPLDAFIEEVMTILKNNPEAEEILVRNVLPLREASYQGADQYKALFKQRNDLFLNARKKEWDAL